MLPKRLKNYNYNYNYKYKICNKIFENGFAPPPPPPPRHFWTMLKNCGFGTQWLPLVDWVKHCWIFENLIVTVNISDATVTKLLTNSMQDLKMNNLETKKCNNFVFWVLVSVFKCVLKLPAWEPCIFLVCHLQFCCSWQGTPHPLPPVKTTYLGMPDKGWLDLTNLMNFRKTSEGQGGVFSDPKNFFALFW